MQKNVISSILNAVFVSNHQTINIYLRRVVFKSEYSNKYRKIS